MVIATRPAAAIMFRPFRSRTVMRLSGRLPGVPALMMAMLTVLLLALTACGGPTPYRAAGADGKAHGFAEQAIGQDRYRVSFAGNGRTPRAVVEDYLLFRAAELTLQQGYDHFRILESNTERRAAVIDTYIEDSAPYTGHRSTRYDVVRDGYFDRFGPSYSAATRERPRFTATATIRLLRGVAPGGDPQSFDARQVIERLGPDIDRPVGG